MQDLQAQDSKGRPRFHGAFTGGFSAGYFNTVGSKEGMILKMLIYPYYQLKSSEAVWSIYILSISKR